MTPSGVANVMTVIALIEAIAFVVIYSRRIRWRDGMAVHVMAFVAAIAAVLALRLVRVFTHSDPNGGWFAWLTVVVYSAIPIVLAWRLFLLIELGRRRR